MSRLLIRRLQSIHQSLQTIINRRTLLSPAYECNDQWSKRLQEPLIQQIEPDKFFYDINQRFNKKQNVSAVDIDLYANAITRPDQLEELEHLLIKFRKTWKTRDTLDSTHHAVIRNYLQHGKTDDLLRLLEDRIGFGIFPDQFCYNLLLDYFIDKAIDYRNGTRVAILMAFQEDFSNQTANRLAFLAITSYLADSQAKPLLEVAKANDDQQSTASTQEEEEYEYVRVPYVRNAYFDDHFDIKNPQHLIGKSLYLLSSHLGDNQTTMAANSARLVGLGMYEKWDQLTFELEKLANCELTGDVLARLEACVAKSQESNEKATTFGRLLHQKANGWKIDLTTNLNDCARQLIQTLNHQNEDIAKMESMYLQWKQIRQDTVKEQMEQLLEQEKWKEIETKRQELKEREEKLFFFENFAQIEMKYDQAQKRIEEYRAHMKTDEEYIPPKV